ncbi:MAG: hypothetical protein AAFQ62_05315 [Pseudomonadota bacterium]
MKALQDLFDDWFVFFLHRGDDPKLAWNTGNIMVAIPFIAGLVAVDFFFAVLSQSEPLFPSMNRWAMVITLSVGGLLLGGVFSNRLRFDKVVAQKLSGRATPSKARTTKNLLLWYILPVTLAVLAIIVDGPTG